MSKLANLKEAWRDNCLHATGWEPVNRGEYLPTQRIEAGRDWARVPVRRGMRRTEQRGHRDQRQLALLRESFGNCPSDAQAGETTGPIADDES